MQAVDEYDMEIDQGNKDRVILGEHPGRINDDDELYEMAKVT